MAEIPNNHLGYIKPPKKWEKLPFPQLVSWISGTHQQYHPAEGSVHFCQIHFFFRPPPLDQKFVDKEGSSQRTAKIHIMVPCMNAPCIHTSGVLAEGSGISSCCGGNVAFKGVLGCPRKLGSMVSKWVITPINPPFISR